MQKMMLIIGLFWSGLLRHWFSQQLASNQTALSFCFRVRCFSSQRQPGWYRLLQRLLFYSFCIVCLTAMSYSSLFVVVWLSSAALISLIDWRLLILETQIFYTSLVFLVPLAYLSGWQLFWLQPLVIGCLLTLLFYLLPDKLGFGDVLLVAGWSLFLTWRQLAWLLLLASFSGSCLIFWGKRFQTEPLPFIPFLSWSLLVVLGVSLFQ